MTELAQTIHLGLEPGSRGFFCVVEAPDQVRGAAGVKQMLNVTERTQSVHGAYRAGVQHLRGADHA